MRTLALLLCVVLVAGCTKSPRVCAVCDRAECKGMAFRVTLENGKVVETCCPRCALHYLESNHQQARTMEATDFATGHWVDATHAVYVSDSDVHPCAEMNTMRDPQGCCLMKTYDRCLPSLIVFRDRAAAVDFQRQHGGKLQTFQEIPSR